MKIYTLETGINGWKHAHENLLNTSVELSNAASLMSSVTDDN